MPMVQDFYFNEKGASQVLSRAGIVKAKVGARPVSGANDQERAAKPGLGDILDEHELDVPLPSFSQGHGDILDEHELDVPLPSFSQGLFPTSVLPDAVPWPTHIAELNIRSYTREKLLAYRPGKSDAPAQTFIRTLRLPARRHRSRCLDDEILLARMEEREDALGGADVWNVETFGCDSISGWSFEENAAANKRLAQHDSILTRESYGCDSISGWSFEENAAANKTLAQHDSIMTREGYDVERQHCLDNITQNVCPRGPGKGRGRWQSSGRRGEEGSDRGKHYFDAAESSSGTAGEREHYFASNISADVPKQMELQEANIGETGPGAVRAKGVAVPLYAGLDLQPYLHFFLAAMQRFSEHLKKSYGIDLPIPEHPSHAACASSKLAMLEEPAQVDGDTAAEISGQHNVESQATDNMYAGASSASTRGAMAASRTAFCWPRALHMTAFYIGGRPHLQGLAKQALDLEGTEWTLRVTHLVYAENALLIAVLDFPADAPPTEDGCIPHATLLWRAPFSPVYAAEVLECVMASRLIAPGAGTSSNCEIRMLPRVPVAAAVVDVYAQCISASTFAGVDTSQSDIDSSLFKVSWRSFWS